MKNEGKQQLFFNLTGKSLINIQKVFAKLNFCFFVQCSYLICTRKNDLIRHCFTPVTHQLLETFFFTSHSVMLCVKASYWAVITSILLSLQLSKAHSPSFFYTYFTGLLMYNSFNYRARGTEAGGSSLSSSCQSLKGRKNTVNRESGRLLRTVTMKVKKEGGND